MRVLVAALIACLIAPAVAAQDTVLLRIVVTVPGADGNAVPVPRAQLLISDNPSTREPRRVRTGPDGTVEVKLPPGNYTVESDVPVRLGARVFAWTRTLDVPAGRETVLQLTAENSDADVDAVAAAAVDAGRATHADGAVILNKWQSSVAEIWTPMRHATGFVIDARGLIATSDRALGEATDVEVEFGSGANRVKVAGRVIASERVKGVTLIWIDPAITRSRPPIAPSCSAPQPQPIAHDDKIVALIAPMLESKTALPGMAIRPDLQSFRADWNIDGTSAGGPVFDADGTAVGITVGAADNDANARRRQDSYVIPLHNACSVIAAAEQKMAAAKPPAGTLLRTEAGLPHRRPVRVGGPQKPQMMPPLVRADDYDVSLMTPAMINSDRTTSNTRNYFGYWSPYVAAAPDVLIVRVSPQFEESLWRTIARGAASTQGVALPPMPSFTANFGRMRAFCGGAEVMAIRRFIIETPVGKGNPIREGAYVFAMTDFGPGCGTVRFELFSEKSPAKGDSRTVDPAVFAKIAEGTR